MSRQSFPANYTQWKEADIEALKAKVLKNETKSADFEECGKRLIKALAYKAVHVTEAGKNAADAFDTTDSSCCYTCVFALCTQNKSMEEKLYEFYKELWTEYLTDVVAPATAAPETNSEKLVELSRRYKHFMILLKTTWSKQIFLYLDRFYTPKKNLPTTLLVGYQKWREIIFQGKESGVQEAVLDLIYKDRQGEVVDRDQLQTVIRIWVDCGLKQDTSRASANNASQNTGRREITSYEMYEKDFEDPFLQQTRDYYEAKSNQWTQEDSFPDYMKKAEKNRDAELKRRADFLDKNTEPKLMKVIDEKLIGDHQHKLATDKDTGFNKLLEHFNLQATFKDADKDDLSRVYRMFSRLEVHDEQKDGVGPLATMFREYLEGVGRKIVAECSRHCVRDANGKLEWVRGKPKVEDNLKEIIAKLADRFEMYRSLVNDTFHKDEKFIKALKEAFVTIMTMRHVTAPEYTDEQGVQHAQKDDGAEVQLSQYFATLLCSKDADDIVLQKVQTGVDLFSHCAEKDKYINFHAGFLAKRLLVDKSVNVDWEQQTVQWLHNHVGAKMVNNMSVMLIDMNAQENLDNTWTNASTYCTQGSVAGVKTAMKVLTYGKWPNYKPVNVTLHPQVNDCFDKYGQWYRSTRPKTNLEHLYGLSTVEMSLWFVGARKKICSMNAPMATILLQFANSGPGAAETKLTVGEIYNAVGYDKKGVNSDLYQLTHNKDRTKNLLTHNQTNRQIRGFTDNDEISLNKNYQASSGVRIDFVEFNPELTQDDKDEANRKIEEERRHSIDACIVRIAKREGKQKKQQFYSRVIKELQEYFPCPAAVVGMRMDRLVSGDDTGADGVLLKYNQKTDEYEYNADGN